MIGMGINRAIQSYHQYNARIMYHCSKISTSSPSSKGLGKFARRRTSVLFYVELQGVRVRLTVTPPGGPKRKYEQQQQS